MPLLKEQAILSLSERDIRRAYLKQQIEISQRRKVATLTKSGDVPILNLRELKTKAEVKMLKAYILINTRIGRTAEVARRLKEMPEVRRLDVIMGPYDIIAEVETEDHDALSDMVLSKIQTIDDIQHTMTCPVVRLEVV